MRSLLLCAVAASALLFVSAGAFPADDADSDNADCDPVPSGEPTECDEGVEQMLQDGNAAFTGRFLYEALKGDPNENNIMSPFSVLTPLSQLALYSDGDTMNQLMKVLNMPNKSNIRCVFPPLISNLRAEENVVLNMASRIFAADRYPLSEAFLSDTKKVFDSQAENLDFSKPRDAANRINQWVESQTNDRIKNIAKPDMFNGETRLVLANAIYFLGNWIRQFKETSTSKRTFYLSNGTTVEVETMYQKNSFKYGESSELDCKVLEMFYKGGNFSFVVFLPNKVDGLLKLVENLQDSSKLYAAYEATRYEEVEVYLPKMKIESEYNLSPIMNAVGITDVLSRTKSNLNGILKEYEPLYISKAVQKAFVQVDEKGTEAAAANVFVGAAITSFRPPPPVYEFKADHPFAFYIFNKKNVIFSGAKVK